MNQAQFEALIREVRAINENLTRIHASVIDLVSNNSKPKQGAANPPKGEANT